MVVNAMPENMFPSAVVDWQASTLTWAESAILWFIDQITNKPDWHVKVFNDEIVSKWKAEVLAVDWPAVGLQFAYFDDDMFEFASHLCCSLVHWPPWTNNPYSLSASSGTRPSFSKPPA